MQAAKQENFMISRTMDRARRSARAVLHGPELLELVTSRRCRRALIAAAEAGHPPVAAISADIEKLVGLKDAKLLPVRQFVGRSVRAVLEEEGFQVAETGVRLSNDAIFRTGAVYKRIETPPADSTPDLIHRMVDALTDEEALTARNLLTARLKTMK
jgi:hypothetical protein